MFNRLLQRQINKQLGGDIPDGNFLKLLEVISASYDHFEHDRTMLERSIEVSSEEMIELNRKTRQAHDELRALFDHIEEVFFSWDHETGKLLLITPACEKLYGFSVQELLASPDLWTGSTLPEDVHLMKEAMEGMAEQRITREFRIRHRGGEERCVEMKATRRAGHPSRTEGVVSDVTERRAAMIRLAESEEKFRSLFDNARDPMLLLNEKQLFIDCNDAAVRILGAQSKQEVIHKLPRDLSPEYQPDGRSSAEKSMEMDRNAFLQGSTQFEWMHCRMDGSPIPIDVSLSRILFENEHLLLVHWRDISERKKAEEKLMNQNTELKKANEELDRFVYSVSHDLRAPLSSMLGIIDISLDEAGDSFIRSNLNMLKTSVRKLDGIISDILDYSRNSRAEVKNERIQFSELVADVVRNLKFAWPGERDVHVSVFEQEDVILFSDKSRLTIILNNLISNAIRYQDYKKSDPLVEIRVSAAESGCEITVRDNGAGISPTHLPRIFEMFYRGSRVSGGSGLGLYIVQEAVARLRGEITAGSVPGEGTTFTIFLPA